MEDLEILVSLGTGSGQEAVYYTCDFSHEYVTIVSYPMFNLSALYLYVLPGPA